MPTFQELGAALANADKAGDAEGAKALAGEMSRMMAAPQATVSGGVPVGRRSWADVPGEAISNIGPSAAKFGQGLYEAVSDIPGTLGGIADLAGGGLRIGAQKALPPSVFNFISQYDNPETAKRTVELARSVGGQYAEEYGSEDAIKNKIATDPIGFVSDISTLATGGSLATARLAPKISSALRTGAIATDPLSPILYGTQKAANVVAKSTPYGAIARRIEPYTSPDRVAANALIEAEDPNKLIEALKASRGLQTTPGAPTPTMAERAIAGGLESSTLAGLEQGLGAASPELARKTFANQQQKIAAIQKQLQRIDADLAARANTMAPETVQLKQVRDTLLRELADDQAALKTTSQGLVTALPDVSPAETGKVIAARAQKVKEGLQTEVSTPFKKAEELAGGATTDISGIVAEAERILGKPLSQIDPATAPETAKLLEGLRGPPTPGVWTELAPGAGFREAAGPPTAPQADLRTLNALREAVSADVSSAKAVATTNPTRARELSNLYDLNRSINAAIKNSEVFSPEVKALHEQGMQTFKTKTVPQIKTGPVVDILRTTKKNEPGMLPDLTIDKFLEAPTRAEQFLTTFKGDPAALDAMKTGVLSKFRNQITDPLTKTVKLDDAAAFQQTYAKQIDALEKSGVDVRAAMEATLKDAQTVERGMKDLELASKTFKGAEGKPLSAQGIVELALSSPVQMTFVQSKLKGSPGAMDALKGELTDRAVKLIQANDPEKALQYLNDNAKTLKIGLKDGKTFDELKRMAEYQRDVREVAKGAPTSALSMEIKLADTFTPAELTDLTVVANDVKRMQQIAELTKGGGAERGIAADLATEQARKMGTSIKDAPQYFTPVYTTIRNRLVKLEERVNRKAAVALHKMMVEDPDSAIAALTKAQERVEKSKGFQPKMPPAAPTSTAGNVITGPLSAEELQQSGLEDIAIPRMLTIRRGNNSLSSSRNQNSLVGQ